ncbi:hypothetical protein BLNAU_5139 [Blattamonas nauphoetae]|uniref:Uncharacterized protein n=1 Tax=Blattamonas nauphoetae TaxID=2049346 RepID=A0ABQ9Y855_9EUKA|nr:hypothetical protein BLNAU_5139 [Blattamonas nauphoetae]
MNDEEAWTKNEQLMRTSRFKGRHKGVTDTIRRLMSQRRVHQLRSTCSKHNVITNEGRGERRKGSDFDFLTIVFWQRPGEEVEIWSFGMGAKMRNYHQDMQNTKIHTVEKLQPPPILTQRMKGST